MRYVQMSHKGILSFQYAIFFLLGNDISYLSRGKRATWAALKFHNLLIHSRGWQIKRWRIKAAASNSLILYREYVWEHDYVSESRTSMSEWTSNRYLIEFEFKERENGKVEGAVKTSFAFFFYVIERGRKYRENCGKYMFRKRFRGWFDDWYSLPKKCNVIRSRKVKLL